MSKKEVLQKKKDLAKVLYMSGDPQDEISRKTEVSRVTVSRWINDGGWKEIRAAANITRPELVNKILLGVNDLVEKLLTSENVDYGSIAGQLSKFAITIEKLDKKANIVDVIEVFTAFGKWLQYRAAFDVDVSKELVGKIIKLQDEYISELIGGKIKL
jgi:transposase